WRRNSCEPSRAKCPARYRRRSERLERLALAVLNWRFPTSTTVPRKSAAQSPKSQRRRMRLGQREEKEAKKPARLERCPRARFAKQRTRKQRRTTRWA